MDQADCADQGIVCLKEKAVSDIFSILWFSVMWFYYLFFKWSVAEHKFISKLICPMLDFFSFPQKMSHYYANN